MIMPRLRWPAAVALVATLGSPIVAVAQSAPFRGSDRQGAPRMTGQQRDDLEKRFKERIDAIVSCVCDSRTSSRSSCVKWRRARKNRDA